MISPGYPPEMPHYTRGLARVGARVTGLGDQPAGALDPMAREALSDYIQVSNLWDEATVIAELRRARPRARFDRIECLWEIGTLLAARLREEFGAAGMGVEQTTLFRDKEKMKLALDAAGIRTPRHARAKNAKEIRAAAERIGYPLIVKPVAGAGSADTHRVDGKTALEAVIPLVKHVKDLSVEEFIEGEEFTFDTVCANGEVLHFNMSWYRPRPLIARTVEWISPQTMSLRDVQAEHLRPGRDMGHAVLKALGFREGFTHMEWHRTASGEAVFGEIACRPPGAHTVDTMNYCCDVDLFTGWADAICHGRIRQPIRRLYNCAIVFKRAQGEGRIRRITGLDRVKARWGDAIVHVDLLPVGAPRRNWKMTLLSDGHVFVRHPDLETTCEIADSIGTDLEMFAG
jgi:biotin carboxylase